MHNKLGLILVISSSIQDFRLPSQFNKIPQHKSEIADLFSYLHYGVYQVLVGAALCHHHIRILQCHPRYLPLIGALTTFHCLTSVFSWPVLDFY